MCSQNTDDPKNSPYAESMNVPFMVRFPGKVMPRIDSELLLSSPDIMPTILGLCGLEKQIPETVEGRNYAGRFTGKEASVPLRQGALYIKNIDGERDNERKVISYFPVARGIKTHRYTLSLTIDRKTKALKEVLLFDDLKDPYQMHNLPWQKHKKIVSGLCKRMVPLLKEADDPWYKEQILKELIPYGKE